VIRLVSPVFDRVFSLEIVLQFVQIDGPLLEGPPKNGNLGNTRSISFIRFNVSAFTPTGVLYSDDRL